MHTANFLQPYNLIKKKFRRLFSRGIWRVVKAAFLMHHQASDIKSQLGMHRVEFNLLLQQSEIVNLRNK